MQKQSLQIALFFKEQIITDRPDIKFRAISEKFSDIFNNMPTQFPVPPNAPQDIPFMIMTSKNNLNTCNISKSRIDFTTNELSNIENVGLLLSYIEEVSKIQDIIQFGFVMNYFDKRNDGSKLITDKFLKTSDENLKDIALRLNKQVKINKENFNCHITISDVKQRTLTTNDIQKGILIQKDINNIGLNIKNEIYTSSKLKSIFKGANQTLYSSEIDV